MPPTHPTDSNAAAGPITLLMAADQGFAMPLAVTVRSVLESLPPSACVDLHILDGGISDDAKARLAASWRDDAWPADRLAVTYHRPDPDRVADLVTGAHVNHVAYYRLLAAETLPESISSVLYLDADLLVRRDLTPLWNEPTGEAVVVAAADVSSPYLDARAALRPWRRRSTYLSALRPVPNYPTFGLDPCGRYFNSGVLRMDLAAFRREGLADQMFAILRAHPEQAWCWDQYALNVVLAGRWREVSGAWNQGSTIYDYPNASWSPMSDEEFESIRHDPAIVHFTARIKPWHATSRHPYRQAWWEMLQRTAWQGTLPVTSHAQYREAVTLRLALSAQSVARRIWFRLTP